MAESGEGGEQLGDIGGAGAAEGPGDLGRSHWPTSGAKCFAHRTCLIGEPGRPGARFGARGRGVLLAFEPQVFLLRLRGGLRRLILRAKPANQAVTFLLGAFYV